jgi:acyl-CoA synthetase (AMP-forming)/AMP-acid ligase II
MINFDEILNNGIIIKSSGTTGSPKEFFQSPKKIIAASKVAQNVQRITKSSKIYTCCKITHAAGLLAQTIPGYLQGSFIEIEQFNPYTFVKKISDFTHTHITPLHAKAIMMTKGFNNLNLTGVTIAIGAEPVTWNIIEAFVEKNATVIVNWGMSEIGPIAINHTFNSLEDIAAVKTICPENSTVLGSNFYCDYQINEDAELLVKGDICIYDTWYNTGDRVIKKDNMLFYMGRVNLEVDFDNPKKG